MARADDSWSRTLRVNPLPLLLGSENPAIVYFTRRELLGERMGPVSSLWDTPAVRRILRRQNADGSWTYPGGAERIRTRENYDQLETFRQLGVLVEKHGLTREHPAWGGALVPVSEGMKAFIQHRFPEMGEMYVGLDVAVALGALDPQYPGSAVPAGVARSPVRDLEGPHRKAGAPPGVGSPLQ